MERKYNILILPAGSGMAVAAINSLKKNSLFRIIGADSNNLAPGLYLTHKSYIIPKFNDRNFWKELKKIIVLEKIDLIIPALDPLLILMAENKKELESLGVKIMISPLETIRICRDKWMTYLTLKGKIPLPESWIYKEEINDSFPLIIKPRDGSGSKDVYLMTDQNELEFYYNKVKKPIIQEYLPGREWTVDCLADLNGKLLFCVPRVRIETKAGISVKGVVLKNEKLIKMAKIIADNLNFKGIFFFQAKEDKNGIPKLTEINPRIGGTMSLTDAVSGIYSLAVKMYLGENIEIPKIKENVYVTRYFEDIYLFEDDLNRLKEV